jgi:hypothetical protein
MKYWGMKLQLQENEGISNLRVNTTCAMKVQMPNDKIPYHEVLAHLFVKERKVIRSALAEL